jgi:hypothetical protein
VKRYIFVELFEEHDKTNFYTIRFEGTDFSETDAFFNEFDIEEYQEDIDNILAVMDKIGLEGALERRFRPEGGENMSALPLYKNKLRLYVYRINPELVILGNGGKKATRTYQEDPILSKHVKTLREVGDKLQHRLKNNECQLYNRKLTGNLKFYI